MDARFRTLQIIWAAMSAGVVTYTGVMVALILLGLVDMPGLPPIVLTLGALVAASILGTGLVVRRRLVEAIPPGGTPETRFGQYQTATMIGLALMEGGGLLLITLGLLAGSPTWVLAGGGASLLMLMNARPRANEAGIGGATRR